ncbi:SIS domain-containing protein [Trinickia dinghuensis]|uniref:SIS domain-containing protein n=1 Tax=Trinickia dinghuensis TaxID=2291023 RepID=A0A3D8JQG6_9BURK|nr:SIS domain-containing protein [Trinickia dinghuensis]RDU94681.1 SIS domain-containing protein [Trinickia dinghuensis]
MLEEALSSAARVAAQMNDTHGIAELAARLATDEPQLIATVARGSSDHAAAYFALLSMVHLGVPVVSLPMSVVTLRAAPLRMRGQFALAFSQSGKSPDLIAAMRALRAAGAGTAAFVNVDDSPLGAACEYDVPLLAGAEHSVAATKSYIATLTRSVQLIGHWARARNGDTTLLRALETLPDDLLRASGLDWSAAASGLASAERLMVIARGPCLPVAHEAALKLKETCAIQAESFSSAEVQHGPMELIGPGYSLLIFAPRGPEQSGIVEFAARMRERGANVWLAAPANVPDADLPLVETGHPLLDPISVAMTLYVMVDTLARARRRDVDRPTYLNKVTETH